MIMCLETNGQQMERKGQEGKSQPVVGLSAGTATATGFHQYFVLANKLLKTGHLLTRI